MVSAEQSRRGGLGRGRARAVGSLPWVALLLVSAAFGVPSQQTQAQTRGAAEDWFYSNLPYGLTHDTDARLEAVLPAPDSKAACDRFWAALDPVTEKIVTSSRTDSELRSLQADMIVCGKRLFFDLPLETNVPIPDLLLQALLQTFPEITGRAFTSLGLRENPREPGWPLELPRVPGALSRPRDYLTGPVRTMSCPACHLGQLPDGRYATGMPNDNLDLGRFNQLVVYPIWLAGHGKKDPFPWDPELDAQYRAMLKSSRGRVNLPRVLFDVTYLIDILNLERTLYRFAGQEPLPLSDQRTFYRSGRGRLNPATPMLSEPHHEIYVSTPPIWQMRHFENDPKGMGEPYFGRVISSRNLDEFARQAIVMSTLAPNLATPRHTDPLVAYLRTLVEPPNLRGADAALFSAGQEIFKSACTSCHDGHNGATRRNHDLDDVGTPHVFDEIFHDYSPPTAQSRLTLQGLEKVGMLPLARRGVKSRRLQGLWARQRLAVNGAIEGLDHLLCLNGRTRQQLDRKDPLADSTHTDLCDGYSMDQRQALRHYLEHVRYDRFGQALTPAP